MNFLRCCASFLNLLRILGRKKHKWITVRKYLYDSNSELAHNGKFISGYFAGHDDEVYNIILTYEYILRLYTTPIHMVY